MVMGMCNPAERSEHGLDAYDTLLRGIAVAGEVTASEVTQAQHKEALRLFYRAIELDPSYATAFAWAGSRPTCFTSTARPLYVNDELRAITNSHLNLERAVMMSSTIPSAKYSCSGSPLMFVNGNTAMDGLSGSGRGFGTLAVLAGSATATA